MKFNYVLEIDEKEYNDKKKNVESVAFDISRYGALYHVINFKKPVTVKKAIKEAEKFLSKPLTKYWFDKIMKAEPKWKLSWDVYKDDSCRGDLLGGKTFLEEANMNRGRLFLECGT